MSTSQTISRREFLRLAGMTAAGAALAACVPVTTPPKAPVEVIYAFHDPADFRKEAVELFSQQFPDIKIVLQQIPDEFPTKIFTMAAAGTLTDVVRVWEPMVLDFGRAGQVIDLQPYIDAQPDFNAEDFIESF